jgi:DNA-binding NarL/FixJ family response regulator
VLLDVDGLARREMAQYVRRLSQVSPGLRIVTVGTIDNVDQILELLEAGASSYLPSDASWRELVLALSCVRGDHGRVIINVPCHYLLSIRTPQGPLSQREREVLGLAASAFSNAQIAARLSIREATVKRHLRSVFVKLGAVSRIDAVNKAVDASLIAAPNGFSNQLRSRPG